MKKNTSTKIGCLLTGVIFVLIAVLYSRFSPRNSIQRPEIEGVSWAKAAEKCKARYKTISSSWKVKVPNCRKRTEDDDYYYFSWSKPVPIFVELSNGKKTKNKGTCQVDRLSGDIVHMTFNSSVVVKKQKRK